MRFNSFEQLEKLIRDRISKAVNESGMSATAVADKAGIANVSIYRLLNGQRKFSDLDTLLKLANALNIDMANLFSDQKPQKAKDMIAKVNVPEIKIYYGEDKPEDIDDQYIALPLYESKVAATPDVIDVARDEIKGWVTYRNIHHYQISSLHCFRVTGSSMEPDIKDGDYVIIQNNGYEPPEHPDPNAVYLCQIDDGFGGYGLTLKKVQVADDCLVLVSINREYPVRIIHMPDVDHQVIMGRLVRSWREW